MPAPKELSVRSHVGRDILQSAAQFKDEAAAVWEYVVNSLQYVDRGVSPKVQVQVSPTARRITISDNGAGMSREDLTHFFQMHGENLERRAGRPGRGKFGTGKSAAFGIATVLRVDTTKHRLRNVVSLTRSMIEQSGGDDVPVRSEIKDEATDAPNGTTVTIDDIVLPKIRTAPIIEYIERHLQAFHSSSPEVAVNNHVCAYREPEVKEQYVFEPTSKQAEVVGAIKLTIKVACAPLPEGFQGILVTAGPGNTVAVESCGIETKELGNYLFGNVDVPAIETFDTKIAPYTATRSLELNPQHPVVAELIPFLGSKLEQVRTKLVERAKEARRTEQARRLSVEADKIAEILNQDFQRVRERLHQIRAAASHRGVTAAPFGAGEPAGDEADDWVKGTKRPGEVEPKNPGSEGSGGGGRKAPNVTPRGTPNDAGKSSVDPRGGAGPQRRPRGGFRVDYKNLGRDEERSRYDSTTLTILINLDHAVVDAALGGGRVEDPTFRRLSYEIAFSEYAMALGYEILKQDANMPADDLLFEVRSTLNRVAASAAALYR